jgi:hypothetical protein
VDSQQVAWWPVHQFIESVVAQANYGPLPVAGTPAWCALSDGDPRKLLAVAVSGEHWALRTETCQEKRAEAAREIAEAGGWSAMAQRIAQGYGPAHIPRERRAS